MPDSERIDPRPRVSQVLQETETWREEVLAASQPDVVAEVEPQPIQEPPGPTPRPRPLLRGSRMLPDQRVVARVQAREEEELRKIRIVDPGALDELELSRDVALERLEQEADFAGRGRACGCFTGRCQPNSVRDAAAHDPMATLLFPIQERVGPALVRLPDVRVERTSIADRVASEVLEVVHRTETVEGSERHRRTVFESPDDEGTGHGLVRRETCGEVFDARIEVRDVLLEFSEDKVAPERILLARERIVDQDEAERRGRIPCVDAGRLLRIEVRLQEERLAPRVDVAEVFDRVASRVPQDGASLDRNDLRDGLEALGHLACLRREFLGGIVGQAHEGMNVSLVRRFPFVRRRIPIPRDEGERSKFHAVAEGLAGTIEVFCEETQCVIAFRGESETRDESSARTVVVIVAGLVELLPGGSHLASAELADPRPHGLRSRGEPNDEMVRLLPAVRLQDVALEVLQHLAVFGLRGVDVRVSKVDGHGRPREASS